MDSLSALQFAFAPALASALLHSLWQATLIALVAALALMSMARASARMRHAVGMTFLLAMVLAPVLQFTHFWQIPGSDVNARLLPAMTAPRRVANGGLFEQQSSATAIVLALIWLAGVAVMLLRHFGGWRLVSALEKHPFEPLPANWQRRVDNLRAAMRIGRAVSVRLSKDVAGPFTARLLRPVVWLPLSMLTRLPREQVEALLAHELGHVARMDWLWNGLQCVVESLLFFHPAVWWIGRRIRTEREHACDDLAVAACGDAIALAEALAQLAQVRQPLPRALLAAHGGSLMHRISRLISGPPSRGNWGTRAGIAVVIVGGSLLVMQMGLARNSSPGLHIRATTDGVLGPGDMREIKAHGLDGDRFYRAEVDAKGHLTETYKRNGAATPIDPGVRRWLAEVTRLSIPPAPPKPPSTGALPQPPPPPEIAESTVFQSLLRVVITDRAVIAKLGAPVVMASNEVRGRIQFDEGGNPDSAADADLRFDLRGPNGRATLHVVGQRERGTWSIDPVEFASPSR